MLGDGNDLRRLTDRYPVLFSVSGGVLVGVIVTLAFGESPTTGLVVAGLSTLVYLLGFSRLGIAGRLQREPPPGDVSLKGATFGLALGLGFVVAWALAVWLLRE